MMVRERTTEESAALQGFDDGFRDVDRATALEVAPNPEALKMAFKGIKVAQSGLI